MAKPTIEQISDMSVADAKPLLADLSADDRAKLRELEVAKGEDKQRKGILDAIDALDEPEQKPATKLTNDQRLERIEQALASGDPTTAAMMFAQ